MLPSRSRLVDDADAEYAFEAPEDDGASPAPAAGPSVHAALVPTDKMLAHSIEATDQSRVQRLSTAAAAYAGRPAAPAAAAAADRLFDASDCLVVEVPDIIEDMEVSAEDGAVALEEQHVMIDSLEDAFSEMTESVDAGCAITVVLDAANIGWNHGNDQCFSPSGVNVAIENLKRLALGHRAVDIMAFLPASYMKRRPPKGSQVAGNAMMQTEEWDLLDGLVGSGHLTLVPAGDHDDVYLLTYARMKNGYVVSNDFFVDHLNGISDPTVKEGFRLWLRDRRCSYAFPMPDEFMINPDCELSHVLLTNLTAALPPSTATAVSAHAGTVCRCGVLISDVSALVHEPPSHYSKEQLDIVYSHLNTAHNFVNNTYPSDLLTARQVLHCLLSQDPNCALAAEFLRHIA